MTAFDAALSDSAVSNQDAGEPASGDSWPEAPAPSGNGYRSESYRQLWQPPGRRPPHRQALGQPYVWAGTGQSAASDSQWHEPADWSDGAEPDERAESPGWPERRQPAERPRWPERARRTRGMLPAPVGAIPALPAAPARDEREAGEWPADSEATTSAAYRASILPAGPARLRRQRAAHADGRAARPYAQAELEYSAHHRGYPLAPMRAPTERAVIGNLLRLPMAWCQSGTCINRYADPDALGEVDVRARAVVAGWCADAFGRMICPSCQQRDHVWSTRAPVPWTGQPSQLERRDPRQPGGAGRHGWQH
jgi:hypothetical protein